METPKITTGGKRALAFMLHSAVSHNNRNLAEVAARKSEEKRTSAEKKALESLKKIK